VLHTGDAVAAEKRTVEAPPGAYTAAPADLRDALCNSIATQVAEGRFTVVNVHRGESVVSTLELQDGRRVMFRAGYDGGMELAAFRLARALGLPATLVPPAARTTMGQQSGVAQVFVAGQTGRALGDPLSCKAWETERACAADRRDSLVFLLLIGTRDLHAGNFLVTEERRLTLFDFAGGLFDGWLDEFEGNKVRAIETVSKTVWDRLQALDEAQARRITEAVSETWFDQRQAVAGLLQRRAAIIARVEELVAERGRAAVIVAD
jgi:hypothetical protein